MFASIAWEVGFEGASLAITLEAMLKAVAERNPAQVIRSLGLVVKDDTGQQLYLIFGRLVLEGGAEVTIYIFDARVGVGLAGTLQLGFADFEGNGLLTVGDLKWIIEHKGIAAAVVARLEIDLVLELAIEACVPLPFCDLCWTVVDLEKSIPVFTYTFSSAMLALASSSGQVNLEAAADPDCVQHPVITLSGPPGRVHITLEDGTQPVTTTSQGRSVSANTGVVSFGGQVGRDYDVMVRGMYNQVDLPADGQVAVTVDRASHKNGNAVSVAPQAVLLEHGPLINVPSSIRLVNITNPTPLMTVTVSGTHAPLVIATMSSNNVTLTGTPGRDFVPQAPVTLINPLDTLLVQIADTNVVLDASTVTSPAGLRVTMLSMVQAVLVAVHPTEPSVATVAAVPPNRFVQVRAGVADADVFVPDLLQLLSPLVIKGGSGLDTVPVTVAISGADGPTRTVLSSASLVHVTQRNHHAIFMDNVEIKVFNMDLMDSAAQGALVIPLVRTGEHVLVNVQGHAGARVTHTVNALESGAQLVLRHSGPGEFVVQLGNSGSLEMFEGLLFVQGSGEPEQNLTLVLDARRDPRTLRAVVQRDLLSLIDTASGQGVLRVSLTSAARVCLELAGELLVDHGTFSSYGTELVVNMHPHMTDPPFWFEPKQRLWRNRVTVVGNSAPVLIHGLVDEVRFGATPTGSQSAPWNNCAQRGDHCLAHPLDGVQAPVFVRTTNATRHTALVFETGSSPAAAPQHFSVDGNLISRVQAGGRRQVLGVAPSPAMCSLLASIGGSDGVAALPCTGQAAHVLFAGPGNNFSIQLTAGGGPDELYLHNTTVPVMADLGSGSNYFRAESLGADFQLMGGAEHDVVHVRLPLGGRGLVDLGPAATMDSDPDEFALDTRGQAVGQDSDGVTRALIFTNVGSQPEHQLRVQHIGTVDAVQYDPALPECADCGSVSSPAVVPPAPPAPTLPLVKGLTAAQAEVPAVLQGDTWTFNVESCAGLPFRIVRLVGKGTFHVGSVYGVEYCSVSVLGERNDKQVSLVQATPDASVAHPVSMMSDDGALHVFNAVTGSLGRLTFQFVHSLAVQCPAHGVTLELNQGEPVTGTVFSLPVLAVPGAQNVIAVRGTAGPVLVNSAAPIASIQIGQPLCASNPMDPLSFIDHSLIFVAPPDAPAANISLDAGDSLLADPQAFGLNWRCLGPLDNITHAPLPASELVQRYPASAWWRAQAAGAGVPAEMYAQDTCAIGLALRHAVYLMQGGAGDVVWVNASLADAVIVDQAQGNNTLVVEHSCAPLTVRQHGAQPTRQSSRANVTEPCGPVELHQGDGSPLHANLFTLQSHYLCRRSWATTTVSYSVP